jgi:hypothetical protein
MSAKHCPRLWEIEAAHSGRLSGASLHSAREHLATHCQECGDEARYLASLERRLRQLAPPDDEVALRRLRRSTLERAQALSYGRVGARARGVGWAALGLGACAALAGLVFWLRAPTRRASVVVVTAQADRAKWSQHRERDIEQVDLGEGVFSLVVRRHADDPRVVVRIPEGEIEDLGTVFSVTVRGGKTTRIAVSQGAVVLRRRGLPELRLLSGSRWEPAPNAGHNLGPELATSVAAQTSLPPLAAGDSAPVLVDAAPARSAMTAALRIPLASRPPEARVGLRSRAPRLRIAKPGLDPVPELPAEDETYLELIRLVRQQRGPEAQRMAAEYLQHFPGGFRRTDVERIRDAYAPAAL